MSCVFLDPRGHEFLRASILPVLLIACLIASVPSPATAGGPAPGYEIDLQELDRLKGATKRPPSKKKPIQAPKPADSNEKPVRNADGTTQYTVKPGDFLFKILVREFGMSNREAELRIPEIMRINNLSSSTSLAVGQQLVIPGQRQMRAEHRPARTQDKKTSHRHTPEQKTAVADPEQPVIAAVTPEAAPVAIDKPAEKPVTVTKKPENSAPATTAMLTVISISGVDFNQNLDLLLTALSVPWSKDRVIEESAGPGSPESFSIKVERYLELEGKRYVVTGNRRDPYEYTFLRLLEMAGYTVLRLDEQSSISAIASQLLPQLGFTFSAGSHRFTPPDTADEPRIIEGFLVTLKSPQSKVFITETPLDAVNAERLGSSSVEPFTKEPVGTAPERPLTAPPPG